MEKQKETRLGGLNGDGNRRKEEKENMRRERNIKVHLRDHIPTMQTLPKIYTEIKEIQKEFPNNGEDKAPTRHLLPSSDTSSNKIRLHLAELQAKEALWKLQPS